jgi:cardiolipin synthase
MNLPNKLTISRILLIPLFILSLARGRQFLAILTFFLAALTDALDGTIARAKRQQSRLGFFLDPVADKLLINTAFICLAVMKAVPAWVATIVISRDILIALGSLVMCLLDKQSLISPTLLGKATTSAQMATILVALLHQAHGGLQTLLWIFIWIVVSFTIVSGCHYTFKISRMVNPQA